VSFDGLLIHLVDITTPTDTVGSSDRYGNPTLTATTVTGVRARVQQAQAEENLTNRDTRVTSFLMFVPAATVISGLSTIVWDGRSFRVQGEPWVVDGRNAPHHIEARLEEILG
jgi:hypothetical protein